MPASKTSGLGRTQVDLLRLLHAAPRSGPSLQAELGRKPHQGLYRLRERGLVDEVAGKWKLSTVGKRVCRELFEEAPDELVEVMRAATVVEDAEAELKRARENLKATVRKAFDGPIPAEWIADALGVNRTHVYTMVGS